MRTTLRMSVWFAAALAAAILFAARGADAHEYFVGKNVPLPVGQDGKRKIQISVGETVTLTVRNSQGQDCSAVIVAAGFGTSLITVTSPQPAGPVTTREFRITGESDGTTEIDITVQGVDPCTEDTHNPIVVQVLPDPTEILRRFAGAGKSEARILKGSLKLGLNALGEYSSTVLNGFADGAPPDESAKALIEGWYDAYVGGYFTARNTLRNLSNYGSSELISGGWPECTSPLGFADGTRGPFDALRASARVQLDGFYGKLDKQIASDISAYRKIGTRLGINFSTSYVLNRYSELDVSGPTRSALPQDPGADLDIGYIGAATWSNESATMSCLWVAGIGALGSGPVRVELWDGEGLFDSKVVPLAGEGAWEAMFEDVVAGKTYRASLTYDGGDKGHDSGRIFVTPLRVNF